MLPNEVARATKVRPKRPTKSATPLRDPVLKMFDVARVPKTQRANVRMEIHA